MGRYAGAVRRTAGTTASARVFSRSRTSAVRRVLETLALIAAAATVAARSPSSAGERLSRRYDWRGGQPVNFIVAIVQDERGFLWSLSTAGLVRFDGTEMTVWDSRPLVPLAGCGSLAAEGPVLIHLHDRTLWRVRETGGVDPVAGPHGEAPYPAYRAACAQDGVLWTGDEAGRYHVRALDGAWRDVPPGAAPSEPPRGILPGAKDEVLVATSRGIYRLGNAGAAMLAPLRGVVCPIPGENGEVYVGTNDPGGRIYRIDASGAHELYFRPTRLMGLALRGGTLWGAYDRGLVALRGGRSPEFIPVGDTLPGGGPLLVDAEGSLWIGTHRGLVEFPEPEVEVMGDDPDVSRYVVATPDAVWYVSWRHIWRFDRSAPDKGLQVVEEVPSLGAPCADARGSVWISGYDRFVEFTPSGVAISHPLPGVGESEPCDTADDGTRWIPTTNGLARLAPSAELAIIAGPDAGGAWLDGTEAAVEQDGRIWVATGDRVCRTPADLARGPAAPSWTCAAFPGSGGISSLARAGDRVWATTRRLSQYLQSEGEGWSQIATDSLPPAFVQHADARGASSGVWLLGAEYLQRVRPAKAAPGYEVLEKLSGWHGLPTPTTDRIAEDPDGTLWLASNAGLIRVPAGVRRSHPGPPRVALVEATVDGRPLSTAASFTLPYRRNRLEVRFAALSYRAPELVRYRSRLRDADPWGEPTRQSRFRFIDLPPGRYRLTVEASLDGVAWSSSAASVDFSVGAPFYRTAWFYAGLAFLAAGAAFAAHRVRVRQIIRLERQRTRIAMDLHDAVGSGLGGIGIMAGLASRPGVSEEKRLELSTRIASVAREVGGTVGDIVWSLRPGEIRLEDLAAHLVDRAASLFPEGTAVERDFPAPWPPVVLTPEARRGAYLIGTEALHNAARHARPARVTIGLRYADGRAILTITDDGAGRRVGSATTAAEPSLVAAAAGGGLGLPGMRRRAEEMGASFRMDASPQGGTVVELVFDPRAAERIT